MSITYGAGYFVIVSANGWIFTSSDTGKIWVPTGYNLGELDCVIYANNMFIACGDHLYTSPAVNAIRYTAPKASANQLLTITNNTARFTLKQAANTSLTLFDLSGKAIAKLINGQKAAGTYSTALPSMLPQGRCLLSLTAGEASCVTHVMIMR